MLPLTQLVRGGFKDTVALPGLQLCVGGQCRVPVLLDA